MSETTAGAKKGVVATRKRVGGVGGVRGQRVTALTVETARTPAVSAGEIVPVLAPALQALAAGVRGDIARKLATVDDEKWFEALVIHAVQSGKDVNIALNPGLTSALDVALAYSMPPRGGTPEAIAAKVQQLRRLTYDDGSLVFPANPELAAESLVELADGTFDAFLASTEPGPLDRQAIYWRNPRTIEGERQAERLKFVSRGRATTEASGPPCPKCDSRNTVTLTEQLRSNDEAATETFYCRDCGYQKRS